MARIEGVPGEVFAGGGIFLTGASLYDLAGVQEPRDQRPFIKELQASLPRPDPVLTGVIAAACIREMDFLAEGVDLLRLAEVLVGNGWMVTTTRAGSTGIPLLEATNGRQCVSFADTTGGRLWRGWPDANSFDENMVAPVGPKGEIEMGGIRDYLARVAANGGTIHLNSPTALAEKPDLLRIAVARMVRIAATRRWSDGSKITIGFSGELNKYVEAGLIFAVIWDVLKNGSAGSFAAKEMVAAAYATGFWRRLEDIMPWLTAIGV